MATTLPSFEYTLRDFTNASNDMANISAVRMDLQYLGVSVIKVHDVDSDMAQSYETGIQKAFRELRPDGGTAHGSKSMAGITKHYGVASHPEVVRARLDDAAKGVFRKVYGLVGDDNDEDLVCGWDAAAYTGPDSRRERPPSKRTLLGGDPEKTFYALTGGKLQGHTDLGLDSPGQRVAARMQYIHPTFPWPVQAQLVCHSVPEGGSTFVFVPGVWTHPHDASHFRYDTGRDFCVCTKAGYEFFHGRWRCIDGVPRGCLIMWLSNTPHGNKLADFGVTDPIRMVVYICWQSVRLAGSAEERRNTRKRKLEAAVTGASTDHWATHVKKLHRGSHYSNGKGVSHVLYHKGKNPVWDRELWHKVLSSL